MTVAIDFDGTLCERNWPDIGAEKPQVIRMAKEMQASGDKLILWTCRTGERLEEAVRWCAERGLFFDAVNDNLPEAVEYFGGNSRKVAAGLYIDDKSVNEILAVNRHEFKMTEYYAQTHKCEYCELHNVTICRDDSCYYAKQEARESFRRGRE